MEPNPDYIIVGGGSAGCVLAGRLSEDPNVRVLLLEAGNRTRRREAQIPAAWPKLLDSDLDWALETEPVPYLDSRRVKWPRGKALGGSGAINAMIHMRGLPADFALWRHQAGCTSWDWPGVLPYYERSLLPAQVLRCVNPISRAFCAAAVETGLGFTPDFNGEFRSGAGFFRVAQQEGRRATTAGLYLDASAGRRRSNLTIATGVVAHRLILDGQRIIGVEFSRSAHGNKVERILCNRDVILAAGAVHSPRILMSSGIGPADRLHSLGIRVRLDLPGVGENLQDHLLAVASFRSRQAVTFESAETLGNLLRYVVAGRGPLTSNLAEAGALVLPDSAGVPTVQLLFAPAFYMSHGAIRPGGPGFSIGATVLRPKSRGQILLRSLDPLTPPLIQPEYLMEPSDLDQLIDGLQLARQVANAAAMDPFRGEEIWPGSTVTTPTALAAFIRRTAETLYHPAGTCAMGDGPLAVVNPSTLAVWGVEGLRVADASIMPTLVSANPNATVVMLAEKAAAIIGGKDPARANDRSGKKIACAMR